jgi:hypothetical protein
VRRQAGLGVACVEIEFRAPHAIDATLSPYNLTHWLISTQAWPGRNGSETTSRCSSPMPARQVYF